MARGAHATDPVPERGYATVPGAHEETSVLDGSELRQSQVDPGLGGVTEPGIVGQICEQIRVRILGYAVGQRGYRVVVADQRADTVLAERQRSIRFTRFERAGIR